MGGGKNDELLLKAAQGGKLKAVEKHLKNGANIEARHAGSGATPMLIAAGEGHLDVVRLLVEKGCNLAATNKFSHDALRISRVRGHGEIFSYLSSVLEQQHLDGVIKRQESQEAFKF